MAELPSDERYEDVTTTDDDVGGAERLFGSLKTQLRWYPDTKALFINVRQTVETGRGVEIKYKGSVHTGTGEYRYRGQLRKPFYTNTPTLARIMAAERGIELRGDDKIDADKVLPAGIKGLLWRDWSVAPGVALCDAQDRGFVYTLGLRKQPQIIKRGGAIDSWVSCKATLEFNPATQSVGAYGNARLKLFKFGLTNTQDARISLGWDWVASPSGGGGGGSALALTKDDGDDASSALVRSGSLGSGGGGGGLSFKKLPYVKVAENDWAIRWQGDTISFTYNL